VLAQADAMLQVLTTRRFLRDLDVLDTSVRVKIPPTVRQLENNPQHTSLVTEKIAHLRAGGRKIYRSRINIQYRLVWEDLGNGRIALQRVGNHTEIDRLRAVSLTETGELAPYDRHDGAGQIAGETTPPADGLAFFERFHDNLLRVFGVADATLEAVKALRDPEAIWSLPEPQSTQLTLYHLWMYGAERALETYFDPEQLIYRTTVDQLEHYCEGRLKQLLLNLNEKQQEFVYAKSSGPLLIKGVAGSGKTTIGLYRALRIADYFRGKALQTSFLPDERPPSILILTYNRTLVKALHQLLDEITTDSLDFIDVKTFHEWYREMLLETNWRFIDERGDVRRNLALAVLGELRAEGVPVDDLKRDEGFLLDEIDEVIYARNLRSLDDYLAVNRVGRGEALQRPQREVVWAFFTRYRPAMHAAGYRDFSEGPVLLLEQGDLNQYDVIIVDEAQDVPPAALQVARRAIAHPEGRGLNLLADPAQSIYYQGISWKESGLALAGGRTRVLEQNYRNTRQILRAAECVIDQVDALKDTNEYVSPVAATTDGPKPLLLGYQERADAEDYLVREIARLCQTGDYRPGDIAILAKRKDTLTTLEKVLRREKIPARYFKDSDFDVLENQVKLITMHSAKGLQFPVVFLVELAEKFIPYLYNLPTAEYDARLVQERKLFYVAITRASDRLYMLYPKVDPSRFIHDFDVPADAEDVVTRVMR
jgi:superfamily I DNA/RNA helicase/mRNA-degrading endonuclease RelE of RelBE toxin-antitoxin system